MSRPARNSLARRARTALLLGGGAAAVNLLLLGGLLALNSAPSAAPGSEKPVRLHAVRLGAPPAPAPKRETIERSAPAPDRPSGGAAREVLTLSEEPVTPGVRGLDFSVAPGLSDLGVVPAGLLPTPSAPGLERAVAGRIGGAGGGDGTGVVGVAELDRAPQERSTPMPAYPASARRAGIEGYVETKLLLDEKGEVEEVVILKWEGHTAFVEAVRTSLARWRFTPAVKGGRPVRIWKPYVVRFKLES
jgi:protein TonB